MMEYRKKNGTDVWHWCENCAEWPAEDYTVTFGDPVSGKLDEKCRDREKDGLCTKATVTKGSHSASVRAMLRDKLSEPKP